MPFYFLDTSALAKRYLPETGSSWLLSILDDPTCSVAISAVASVELASALAGAGRRGEITTEQQDTQYRQFIADAGELDVLDVSKELLARSSDLLLGAGAVALRSLDAIQLASAIWWSERLNANNMGRGVFVVADRRLREAASALGLPVDNPEERE